MQSRTLVHVTYMKLKTERNQNFWPPRHFTLSLPESIMETWTAVLTFESVDEILHCMYSSTVLSHDTVTIWFQYFTTWNLEFFLNFDIWHSWELKGNSGYILRIFYITFYIIWSTIPGINWFGWKQFDQNIAVKFAASSAMFVFYRGSGKGQRTVMWRQV